MRGLNALQEFNDQLKEQEGIPFDVSAIERTLPHRKSAIVLDSGIIHPDRTSAIGKFLIRSDDVRIFDHYGIMPGHLTAEFVHLTAAMMVLYDDDDGRIPVLRQSKFSVVKAVVPGDEITCLVEALSRPEEVGRQEQSFVGAVWNESGEIVMLCEFSALALSKKILQRLIRNPAERQERKAA